ncbi:MAG: hypothetical protein ACRCV6_06500 [Formosimonas sp.]
MSTLKNLIQQSKKDKSEMIASTVRLTPELHSFIDEFADSLSKSRQEIFLILLQEAKELVMQEINNEDADCQEAKNIGFHVLNTNKGNSLDDHKKMLAGQEAAAFYDPWKFNINRVKKGDVVFLYENNVGIVAYGVGTGETLSREHEGNAGECHYQKLSNFTMLAQAIKASKVREILDRNVVFLRTMSGMPDGQKLIDYITANA